MNSKKIPPATVLVIEDQEEMRLLTETALSLAGYRVVTAANGREAGSALAREKIDLVLTDLLMPERDGMELMNELRSTRPELPVIAMSGGGRMSAVFYLDFARKMGAKTLLEKPFSNEALLAAVAAALPGAVLPAGDS